MIAFFLACVAAIEAYQVLAHVHCLSGFPLPASHRTLRGFTAATVFDLACYAAVAVALGLVGGPWWIVVVPLLAHAAYGYMLIWERMLYQTRIHDYQRPSIYSDGVMRRAKFVAAMLDSGFHMLALILIMVRLPVDPSTSAGAWVAGAWLIGAVGGAAYFAVFGRVMCKP